jgi:hypothetical protein
MPNRRTHRRTGGSQSTRKFAINIISESPESFFIEKKKNANANGFNMFLSNAAHKLASYRNRKIGELNLPNPTNFNLSTASEENIHTVDAFMNNTANYAEWILKPLYKATKNLGYDYFNKIGINTESPGQANAIDAYEKKYGRDIAVDAEKYIGLILKELKRNNLSLNDLFLVHELDKAEIDNSPTEIIEIYNKIMKIEADSFKKVQEPNPIKRLFKRSRRAKRNIY